MFKLVIIVLIPALLLNITLLTLKTTGCINGSLFWLFSPIWVTIAFLAFSFIMLFLTSLALHVN